MRDLIDLHRIWAFIKEWWARSLAIVLVSVSTYGAGQLSAESRILDDCKIMSVFRVGIQAFNCQPRIR